MKVNQATFCSAPWFQVRQDIDGSFRCCCVIKHNNSNYPDNKQFFDLEQWLQSDYLDYLKHNLTNGVKLAECKKCWDKEKNEIPSMRTFVNNTVANGKSYQQSWLPFYFKNKTDLTSDMLISADIKTSNVCNYSCAMCNPYDSSKIHALYKKNKQHPYVSQQLEQNPGMLDHVDLIYREGSSYKLLDDVLQQKPRYIKFLGGEPLLDKQLLIKLQQYPHKNNTTIIFVTNGSVDLCDIQDKLAGYHTVYFTVSLEGIQDVQDFVSKGSDWQSIEQNITNYINTYGTRNITIHHTLQALTLAHFVDLLNWTNNKQLSLTVNILENPNYLSLSAMPLELFNCTVDEISKTKLKIHKQINDDVTVVVSTNDFVNFIKSAYNHNALFCEQLREFLDWYDSEQQWKHILTEWLPYLD